MSSNISISRICQFCGMSFLARTTVTRFCSHTCNQKFYKQQLKNSKIEKSNAETIEQVIRPNEPRVTVDKEVLKVKEVAQILGASLDAVYDMIKSGRLKATNLGVRGIRVLRSEVLEIFRVPALLVVQVERERKVRSEKEEVLTKDTCYSMKELVILFNKNRDDLYTFLSRKGVPKIKEGKEVFYDRAAVDKLYKQSLKPRKLGHQKEREANLKLATVPLKKQDCYTIEECVSMFGKRSALLYGIFNRRKVPKLKIGTKVFVSKKAVDKILRSIKKGGKGE